ncbi:MAG: hypothetical protein HGA38_01295 [Candidatus Moranbacteria bacterium]|nr:hypothetical protein [Candidatus Moranbacteria bacterium]NTW45644.1 hypothetical protein [Candidatus Moranbacteria bacterium]
MGFLTIESFPLEYEFRVSTDPLAICLSIAPSVIDRIADRIADSKIVGSEPDPFVASKTRFGYGGVMKACEPHPALPDFLTYSFRIPKGKKTLEQLDQFSRSMSRFLGLSADFERAGDADIEGPRQLLTFDFIGQPDGKGGLGYAGFSFSYDVEVLSYIGAELWEDANRNAVIDAMRESYFRVLAFGKRDRSLFWDQFFLGQCYGSEKLVRLRVPGDCACIGTDREPYPGYGHSFSPHNIDTYYQQISLMTGVIKIANLAREWILSGKRR